MDYAGDILAGLRNGLQPATETVDAGLDWGGLHARLSAAHAARRELGAAEVTDSFRPGGFERWAGRSGQIDRLAPIVNPTGLSDGKTRSGIESGIAGEPNSGGRGQ